MFRSILRLAGFGLAFLVMAALSGNLFADPFSNGDFESNPAHVSPPWQQLSIGTWGTNHGPYGLDPANVGNFYAELGNPGQGCGGIYQSFDTVFGQQYSISFWGSGWDGNNNHTGYVAVSSGTWNGNVTTPGDIVTGIPQDLLAATPFVVDRTTVDTVTGVVDGWHQYGDAYGVGSYDFTATGPTSTLNLWNNAGSAARVDNIAVTPVVTEMAVSQATGNWSAPSTWTTPAGDITPTGGIPAATTEVVVIGGNTVQIGAADSPAAAKVLFVKGATLELLSGGTLSISQAGAGSLQTTGGMLSLLGGSTLTVQDADTASSFAGLSAAAGATINVNNTLTVNANIDLSNVNVNANNLTLTSGTFKKSDGLAVNNMTVTGGGVNIGGAGLTINSSLTVSGATFDAGGANPLQLTGAAVVVQNGGSLVAPHALTMDSLTLNNGGVSGAGAISAATAYNFQNVPATNPAGSNLGGAAVMNVGGDGNTVVLTGINTYSGATTIKAGALQAVDGVSLPTASNLQFNGGVFESHGAFTRGFGSGAGQVQWIGDGGFSAAGGDLTVTLADAPDPVVWGTTPNFVGASQALRFGSLTATNQVTFTHNLDLNGGNPTVNVTANWNSATSNYAVLSGKITDGGLVKQGDGTLVLSNAGNTYAGDTNIQNGAVQAVDGVGLPAASNLVLNGGVFESHGNFTRGLGAGLTWNSGGFSANGGNLLVTLGDPVGGLYTSQMLGNGGIPANLVFGSATANGQVVLPHDIDLNGYAPGIHPTFGYAGVTVNQGGAAPASALLSGVVNDGGIEKWGSGELVLNNPATTLDGLYIHQGTVTLNNAKINNTLDMLILNLGANTQATLNIQGNTNISLQNNTGLWVSYDYGTNPGQLGVVNMTGGTISQDGSGGFAPWEANLMLGGNGGKGIMNQSGGLVSLPRNGVVLGWWDDGTHNTVGIYNLNGGTLSTFDVQRGSPYGAGQGYFNFNGGVLQATADNPSFLPGNSNGTGAGNLNAATVQIGGAKIDTNGHAITIAQPLLHDAATLGTSPDGGLTKLGDGTLTLAAQESYNGRTVVAKGVLTMLPASAPVAEYSASAASGATVNNLGTGGAAMNGTLNGATIDPTGFRGHPALNFGGAGSVDINNGITDLSGAGNWTVSYWIDTTQNGATIFNKGDGTSWNGGFSTFYLKNPGNGGGSGGIPGAVRWGGGWMAGSTAVNNGAWHFVTITDNGGTKSVYVDGVFDPLTGGDFNNPDTGTVVRLGWAPNPGDGPAPYLVGELQDVRMYGISLNAAQVASLYSTGVAGVGLLPAASPLTVVSGGTLDLAGNPQTVASLDDGGGAGGVVTNSGVLNSILSISGTSTTTFSGSIVDGPTNKMGLTLNGGTLMLSGANTYKGGTDVLAGELIIAAPDSIADGSSLTVGAGASSIFGTAVSGANIASSAVVPVPEPGTLALLVAGLTVGFGVWRRRK